MEVYSVESVHYTSDGHWFCKCPECGEETPRILTRFGPYSCDNCEISFMVMYKYYHVEEDCHGSS